MGRKVLDIVPVISVRPTGGNALTNEVARAQASDIITALKEAVHDENDFEFSATYETDARCEHCNATWTADGAEFNGGCCGLDEANDPERLARVRTLAETVSDGTFYRYEDGKRGRVPVNWPDQLGCAVVVWLDAGRPEVDVRRLISLTREVKASDWCTVWEDPGPSGCSLPRLPDQVSTTSDPENLADELLSLIDDMGLLPARKVA